MKHSEFSEKIFEIFVDHLLINKGFNIYVPSQFNESNLGYDAFINNVKLLHGKRIKGIALQFKVVSKYKKPFMSDEFRFQLHRGADKKYKQHNQLCNYNKRNIYAGYVVPYFVEFSKLYECLNDDTLLKNTYVIQPHKKILDSKSHYISFNKRSFHQHSNEWIENEIMSLYQIIEDNNKLILPEEFISFANSFKEDSTKKNSKKSCWVIAYKERP